jgi:hypothetical protein
MRLSRILELLEDVLGKKVQIVFPFRRVVSIPVNMPDVRDAFLLEVLVNALAYANQTVLVPARQPQRAPAHVCLRRLIS